MTELTVERIVPGGSGMAHHNGQTVFVPRSAPGDKLLVRIERSNGKLAHARLIEVLAPGPDRIAPPYPELDATGAVDFSHLSAEGQRAAKLAIARDAFRRTGKIDLPEDFQIVPSPAAWGYRARAGWQFDPRRPAFGYAIAGSNVVRDLEFDPLATPLLGQAFSQLHEMAVQGEIPGGGRTIFAGAAGGMVSIDFAAPEAGDEPPTPITTRVAGEQLTYDARCFFQANPFLLESLVAEALSRAEAPANGESLAIDLFSGVGLFSLPLARKFRRVIAVESDLTAAAFANDNALYAGLTGVRVAPQTVESWLATAWKTYRKAPFLLLDPPRAGLSPAAMRGVLSLRPGRIGYVSCDPVTLARDARLLLDAGYMLEHTTSFDLFPQTHHLETIAHFVDGGRPDSASE